MRSDDVLLLCHTKKHKYDFLKVNLSKNATKFKTLDSKVDITQPISIKDRFQIITSVHCPFMIYDDEQTFKNIYDLLAPGGLFMTKFGGASAPVIKLSDSQKEKYDIPISYNHIDISKIIKSPHITKYFKVVYLCQQKLSSIGQEGYIYTTKSNKSEYADMSMPQCLIKTCSVFGIDIEKWINFNRMELVVLQKI
jgi:hypothetical protein